MSRARTETGELAALVEGEVVLEVDGVRESGLLRVIEANGAGASGVEGETTLRAVRERVRALGVGSLHRLLAIRCLHVVVRQRLEQVGDTEGGVGEGESIGGCRGSSPERGVGDREELLEQAGDDTGAGGSGGARSLSAGDLGAGGLASARGLGARSLGARSCNAALGGADLRAGGLCRARHLRRNSQDPRRHSRGGNCGRGLKNSR